MSDELAAIMADLEIKAANRRTRHLGRNRQIRVKRLSRQLAETMKEDSVHFNDGQDGVVLGVYGTEDWIFSSFLKQAYNDGRKITQLDGTWLTSSDFDLNKWVDELFSKYMFFGSNSVLAFTPDNSIVKIKYGRGKIEVEIYGEPQYATHWYDFFNVNFKAAENLIEWIYNSRGDDISVPLNYRPAIRAAYPWIHDSYENITDYIDEYIDSEASVLILIGPPGTGKTTFIKNLIHRSKANAKVAYDPKVMSQDDFFAGFIADETRFLIMEDADEFLKTRTEGNSMMHKFLNVSDGLISAADKKLVFSTNLPNISDIDEALMRPGRCFDVLQFRGLTRAEARQVLREVASDRELPDGDSITLAELFSVQPSGKVFARRKIGFIQS